MLHVREYKLDIVPGCYAIMLISEAESLIVVDHRGIGEPGDQVVTAVVLYAEAAAGESTVMDETTSSGTISVCMSVAVFSEQLQRVRILRVYDRAGARSRCAVPEIRGTGR